MTGPEPDGASLAALARSAGEVAASILSRYFGGPARGVATKSTPTDLVSDADRASERALVEWLERNRPDDGIVGEEGASARSGSGLTWIVDPLDGTVNFLYGIPIWCVSIAVADDKGPVAGVVADPNRDETFWAYRGGGAWCNEERISVGSTATLDSSLVGTGFAYDAVIREAQAAVAARLLPSVRDVRRLGSAALDLCYLAAGRIDCFYEAHMMEWDKAAGILIIEEAGGRVGTLRAPAGDDHGVLAAGPQLFEPFRDLLVSAGAEPGS